MVQAKKKSRPKSKQRWSARVTRESDALDLEGGVFRKGSARAIARSLKRSAERSTRRKSAPFRSAMSMLTFYINRGGGNLPESRVRVLEQAKDELRKLYERQPKAPAAKNEGRAETRWHHRMRFDIPPPPAGYSAAPRRLDGSPRRRT
jgi:hypothetical protein